MPAAVTMRAHGRIEASMRPGQTAPECGFRIRRDIEFAEASMRPGQTAPECGDKAVVNGLDPHGFNEAGADCPGMR